MPKKSKSTKESGGLIENQEEPKKVNYKELIAEDPDFCLGVSKFDFPNGDKYEGEYCAHVNGLVWRQGKGTYTSKDGQIYVGEWDGDKLDESKDVEISYADGTKYYGSLVNNKYTGSGVYQLEEKVSLTCTFSENKPTGEITLIDPNGRAWHGFAEKDDCLLIQEHPFYRNICKDLGKGHIKYKPEENSKTSLKSNKKSSDESVGPKYKDLRDLEKKIFAKSKKTPSKLDSSESEWYQDYVNYRSTYGGIIHKVEAGGEDSLTTEEYDWYRKYKEFETKYIATLKEFKSKSKKGNKMPVNKDLFKLIQSSQYKLLNYPTAVVFPRNELSK